MWDARYVAYLCLRASSERTLLLFEAAELVGFVLEDILGAVCAVYNIIMIEGCLHSVLRVDGVGA